MPTQNPSKTAARSETLTTLLELFMYGFGVIMYATRGLSGAVMGAVGFVAWTAIQRWMRRS